MSNDENTRVGLWSFQREGNLMSDMTLIILVLVLLFVFGGGGGYYYYRGRRQI